MTDKEFEQELQLEAKSAQQDIEDLKKEYESPSWVWPHEKPKPGFYTGYQSKTVKQYKDDLLGMI